MKFQDKRKALVVAAVTAGTMFASFGASAQALLIGKKKVGTTPGQTLFVKAPAAPTPGTVVTLPGAAPITVGTIIVAPPTPAPVVIVPPITNNGANKTLSRTI